MGTGMQQDRGEQDRSLADRLVNYSDAIVAVSFVGVSGLGIAVADPDTRDSVARGADWVAAANVLVGIVASALLRSLRRWELDLRADAPPSPKGLRYSRRLHGARFVIVWFAVAQSVLLMWVIR